MGSNVVCKLKIHNLDQVFLVSYLLFFHQLSVDALGSLQKAGWDLLHHLIENLC